MLTLSIIEVDAHTAHHLYYECLKGDLMRGRTVILVSHHIQLCAPGANYIVAMDNGRVRFQGDMDAFQTSGVMDGLIQSGHADDRDAEEEAIFVSAEDMTERTQTPITSDGDTEPNSETSSTAITRTSSENKVEQKKAPRKLVEEEKRAVGRISKEVWLTYIWACGGVWYWSAFLVIFILAAMSPVAENGWLK